MTELEQAELTDGQGRALSATRKGHAHRLASAAGTNIQYEPRNHIQNDETVKSKIGAK